MAFWAPWDASEEEARADVLRQVEEWATAEPNVTECRVIEMKPAQSRSTRWTVDVELIFREQPVEQPTLWGSA